MCVLVIGVHYSRVCACRVNAFLPTTFSSTSVAIVNYCLPVQLYCIVSFKTVDHVPPPVYIVTVGYTDLYTHPPINKAGTEHVLSTCSQSPVLVHICVCGHADGAVWRDERDECDNGRERAGRRRTGPARHPDDCERQSGRR